MFTFRFIVLQHHVALVQIGGPALDLHLLYYLQHYRSPFDHLEDP